MDIAIVVACSKLRGAIITLKELLPVVLAFAVWEFEWSDSRVMVPCFNQGTVAVIYSYGKVPQIMHLLIVYCSLSMHCVKLQ